MTVHVKQMLRFYLMVLLLIISCPGLWAEDIKVGISRKVITPDPVSIWMGGYAARTKPATGVTHDLWTKAMVFEDEVGNHFILVTMDLVGISHQVSEEAVKRIMDKYGLDRSQVMLTCTHNHSGPVILPSYFEFNTSELQAVATYAQKLTDNIVEAVAAAWDDLKPSKLYTGHGEAFFGKNRRDASIRIRPEDHDVPVLSVTDTDGKLRAVLFGYACHNTTLGGDSYEINGDYAGFAQIELERKFPGMTAMFFQGCGADIDPSPRGKMEHAEEHGRTIASVVEKVLSGELKPVNAPLRSGFRVIELKLKPLDVEYYKKELLSNDRYRQRRARLMLESYSKGWDMSKIQYPLQAVRFGKDLTFVGMGGEVVVDYALFLKNMYPAENLFVAGYSNEVMLYIPTVRILAEGGYEPNSSMIYKGLQAPLTDEVEEMVKTAVIAVLKDIGVKPSGKKK